MRGGSTRRFQDLCRKVTNMPTDGGPENQTALARNILPAFFGAGYALGNERLFPKAMRWVGWSHNWDLVVSYMTNHEISWYPKWIEQFRTACRFVRYQSYVDVLKANLQDIGRADLLASCTEKPPDTAKMR